MAVDFSFELAAMRGEIPEGLSLIDTGACYRLYEIYYEYSKDQENPDVKRRCKAEKAKLLKEWNAEKAQVKRMVSMWKETERARAEVRKNPTPENALKLVGVIDGTMQKWEYST